MRQAGWRGVARWVAIAVAAAAGLGGCGNDVTVIIHDCCVNGLYYTCQGSAAYGRCLSAPPDTAACTQQVGRPCPPDANQ